MLGELAWLMLKVFGTIALIDVVLMYILWRLKVLNRNLDRRLQRRIEKNDFWFVPEDGQKEMLRDFTDSR